MKTKCSFLGMLLIALLGVQLVSCSDSRNISKEEIDNLLEGKAKALEASVNVAELKVDNTSTNLMSQTDYSPVEFEEAMKWWKNREGTLTALNEYEVVFRNYPSGQGPDDYVYYATIIWNCYPPIIEGTWQMYDRMQVQYRSSSSDEWLYYDEADYGIVKVYGYQDPVDLNAARLPTSVQLRYRLLHDDFPGKANPDDMVNRYDKSLATAWNYPYYYQPTYSNPYGCDVKDIDQLETLFFTISLSELDGLTSLVMSIDGHAFYPKLGVGRYELKTVKLRKNGNYTVMAEVERNNEHLIGYIHGIYAEYWTKEINLSFTESHFHVFHTDFVPSPFDDDKWYSNLE